VFLEKLFWSLVIKSTTSKPRILEKAFSLYETFSSVCQSLSFFLTPLAFPLLPLHHTQYNDATRRQLVPEDTPTKEEASIKFLPTPTNINFFAVTNNSLLAP